ncbi:putative HVA22-like protein g [Corylus avellana]|uniref:putative HVA22-like protein g n=1 Tax=Corylus avellana TaxID=13451 RepID=UPI001E223960|nr:putative HVA22-like protein g [Corylus avellana]
MLGDLITRVLVLILGYAYPALECYKTVEKNRVGIEELRFWCQYWILVAILTVLESVADIFISWVPMYGEMKLAFFIYLWYPKTKGTGYVYDSMLRPYVAKHEPDIDHKLLEWRARAWDLAVFYWQNCTELGQTAFLQVLEKFAAQTGRFKKTGNERTNHDSGTSPPPPPSGPPSFHGSSRKRDSKSGKSNKWPPAPSAPPFPGSLINHFMAEPPKSEVAHAHLYNQAEYGYPDDTDHGPPASPETHWNLKSRRAPKPHH